MKISAAKFWGKWNVQESSHKPSTSQSADVARVI